jgi:putative iron-dependent peroxidase
LVLGFGPTLLKDLSKDVPNDFQPFETIKSVDGSGREAKGTQEELLFWMNSPHKDQIWKAQWDARQTLKGHMKVARETMTFIYGNSLDMTGFIDGTGNPAVERDTEVAIVPEDNQERAAVSFSPSVGCMTSKVGRNSPFQSKKGSSAVRRLTPLVWLSSLPTRISPM